MYIARICWGLSTSLLYLRFYPAWDVSERYQSDLHWERHLRDLIELFQRDDIFVMSLRRVKYISKKTFFLARLWDVSKTSLASFCDFSKKKNHKNDFMWFPSGYCNIWSNTWGSLETLKKWNFFLEQCIDINQVVHEYQWVDICESAIAKTQ